MPIANCAALLGHAKPDEAMIKKPTKKPKSTIAVIIATRGRPDIVAATVKRLLDQSLVPDHIYVIGSQPGDIAMLKPIKGKVTTLVGRVGSAHQRNDGLALTGERYDYIVFFDDDFIPSHYWIERMAQVFDTRADVVGLCGVILDDGTKTAGISVAEADAMVERQDREVLAKQKVSNSFAHGGNVGCNMAYRNSAIGSIRFDENLPRYAWLEDSDFRGQVERKGHFAKCWDLWGVHLGHKHGRSSGVTLGYAQIANSIYLARKGTVPKSYILRITARNFVANAVKSIAPEAYVDRRGRMKGNMMALADLVRGRMNPNRILDL
jgi:GT2 family glycosyltransferase